MNATVRAEKTAKTNLVIVKNETPVVSHLVISENTWNDKRSIARLISNYTEQIEEFGVLGFEITKPQESWWRPEKQYFLNENQATFLMTLLKNNEVVVNFKLNLVKAFSKLRENHRILPWTSNKDVKIVLERLVQDNDELIEENKKLQAYYDKEEQAKNVIRKVWSKFGRAMVRVATENNEREELIKKQALEIKQLKAENNKHKALQTNISQLWQEELLISMEEAGVQLGISRNRLFELCRFKKFLKKDNAPYKFYEWEYFVQKKVKYKKGKTISTYMQTLILPKGLDLLKTTFI